MLTRTRLRDGIVERTGLRQSVVALALDTMEEMIREELLQQGEVVFRGLFRVTPVRRVYKASRRVQERQSELLHGTSGPVTVSRIILTLRPVRTLRRKLSAVLRPS